MNIAIIGAGNVGTGLAAAAVAEEAGGRLRIMGTPAEEGGGGSVAVRVVGGSSITEVAGMAVGKGDDQNAPVWYLRRMRSRSRIAARLSTTTIAISSSVVVNTIGFAASMFGD